MNKKTVLACAIIGVLTNGQPVLAEEFNGEYSYQAGEGAKSPGIRSVAIGPASSSNGPYSVAVGKLANSEGSHSISLGVESHSKGKHSLAQGFKAKSEGDSSIAVGSKSESTADYSFAAAYNAKSEGDGSIALGVESHSKGVHSFAAGTYAKSEGDSSIALGVESHSKGVHSFAEGFKAKSNGESSVALGKESHSSGKNSLALGSFSQADREYDDVRLNAIWAEQDNKLNAKKIREVSLGVLKDNHEETVLGQITHVASGTEDTDAVNFYQLKKVKRDVDERIGEVDKIKTTKNNVERFQNEASSASQLTAQHRDNAKTALTETQTHRDNAKGASEATTQHRDDAKIALTETTGHRDNAKGASETTTQHRDNAKVALDTTVKHRDNAEGASEATTQYRNNAYEALTRVKRHENSADLIVKRLEREASLLDGEITQSSDGTMYIGKELEGRQIFVSGKQGDRVIGGVASGVRNSDAVNVSQLNTVRTTANYASQLAQKNSSRINHLEDKLSKTNTKIERGLATSAALTGLFQPYGVGKVNFTASIGGYGASQALAVGTGYRITENAAVKAGVAYSGGNHVMYNASFNFEF